MSPLVLAIGCPFSQMRWACLRQARPRGEQRLGNVERATRSRAGSAGSQNIAPGAWASRRQRANWGSSARAEWGVIAVAGARDQPQGIWLAGCCQLAFRALPGDAHDED